MKNFWNSYFADELMWKINYWLLLSLIIVWMSFGIPHFESLAFGYLIGNPICYWIVQKYS